ncbi:hypothetical protein K458DRAFT_270718, partial [Lentithecium fluviatile CBS 122367]
KSNSESLRAHARREQVALGLKVANILDELSILNQLFETQNDVLQKGLEALREAPISLLDPLLEGAISLIRKIEGKYLPKVLRMIEDVHRLQGSVLDLLNLQQKEAGIDEAKYANQ